MIDFSILSAIEQLKIFAIVRTDSAETALKSAEAAVVGGIKLIEISMSTPGAVRVISDLRRKYGDEIYAGAGAVISIDMADRAIKGGAQFISSPHTNAGIIEFSVSKKIFAIAGAATPTEIMSAWDFGVPLIKVFPVSAFGGPTYIRSLKDSMPEVRMMPVSGITISNIREFFRAGAFAVGVGGSLFKSGFVANDNYASIAEQARALIKTINDSSV
ncbi:MAG: bifunctional 4-hydroxy-2-oxoglutarate aldolase/2-dehydro-3-deoxy-phosphogluconate aldolase [Acidobacteriota bacterium]